MNADVEDAYNWVRSDLNGLLAEGPVDEVVINGDAVGVTGDSAGGYLSLMLGLHAEPPLKAVCPFYGMSDLSTLASGDKVRSRAFRRGKSGEGEKGRGEGPGLYLLKTSVERRRRLALFFC